MGLKLDLEYYPELSEKAIQESVNKIKNNKDKWSPPFFFDTKSYLDLEKIEEITNQFLTENLKNIIILGTGGSIQTLLALKHLSKKKIFPVTSSRAVELKGCLDKTSPEDSLVIPISRGGETLDVNSTIGTFLDRGYKFLGLSSMGTMNEILKSNNSPILDVPDLSGRYAGSVTNVGIVPAYISGINIREFLSGLEEGYKLFSRYENNPALEFLLGGTKGIVVPILWTIKKENLDLTLNSSIDLVNGKSAHTIINYQADATFQALIQQGVPSVKISLKNPSELDIGFLMAFILSSVYYLCLLFNVNWASNPKVNIGKKICNEALKKATTSEEQQQTRKNIAKEKFKDFFD